MCFSQTTSNNLMLCFGEPAHTFYKKYYFFAEKISCFTSCLTWLSTWPSEKTNKRTLVQTACTHVFWPRRVCANKSWAQTKPHNTCGNSKMRAASAQPQSICGNRSFFVFFQSLNFFLAAASQLIRQGCGRVTLDPWVGCSDTKTKRPVFKVGSFRGCCRVELADCADRLVAGPCMPRFLILRGRSYFV
jgi:hypothetical protein